MTFWLVSTENPLWCSFRRLYSIKFRGFIQNVISFSVIKISTLTISLVYDQNWSQKYVKNWEGERLDGKMIQNRLNTWIFSFSPLEKRLLLKKNEKCYFIFSFKIGIPASFMHLWLKMTSEICQKWDLKTSLKKLCSKHSEIFWLNYERKAIDLINFGLHCTSFINCYTSDSVFEM